LDPSTKIFYSICNFTTNCKNCKENRIVEIPFQDSTIKIFGEDIWTTPIGSQQNFLPKKITNVAIGGTHILILLDDGTVKGFGDNTYGQAPLNISFKKVSLVLDTNEYKSNLVTRMTCPICLTNERKVRLNCGHMLCEICSDKVDKCPECRTPIINKDAVFYNKYLKYKNKYLTLKEYNI
jgi:alpha-tubulin suppressor-like RCC1 family protein